MDIISVKVINGNIHCLNDFITRGRPRTYLNASVNSGGATITVFNIEGFSAGNYYCLINPFRGNAELIKMHASTAPAGNTITLAADLAKNHDANEPVYFVNYNKIEFSRATTTTGSKSVFGGAAAAIDPTRLWTIYPDTNTTGYAFCRFNNSDGSTYSSYSHPAPYDNPAYNTAESIINEAIYETGRETSQKLTEHLLKQINECLRDIRRRKPKLSWGQNFNYDLGQTVRGVARFSLPTDIYDKYSFKAIEAVKLGLETKLSRVDPDYFFNILLNGVKFTQVTTDASAADTTLYIDNSYDFDDSGSVQSGSQTLTYSGITRSSTAGELTGIPASGTGAITSTISADAFVWQNHTEGQPCFWTIFNGYLWMWPLVDSSWTNFNLKIDYFKVATTVDSLDDAIDYIQYDAIKNWLKWKIRAIEKNDGVEDLEDPSFKLYERMVTSMISSDRDLNRKGFYNDYERNDTPLYDNPAQWRGESPN